MTEKYLFDFISENKTFKDAFLNIFWTQEQVSQPISYLAQSPMLASDSYSNFNLDYNLDYYSTLGISLPLAKTEKSMILEGSFHIISKNLKHVVILGMFGIGKTSFLKQLGYYYAKNEINNNFWIPVIKDIKSLNFSSAKTLKKSIHEGLPCLENQKIVLLIDGMNEKVPLFIKTFNEYKACIFASSYKNYFFISDYQVFTLEPLPVSLQISRAQLLLPSALFFDYLEKVTMENSQITEFSKIPIFHSYLLANFEKLMHLNRANLYFSFISHVLHRSDLWQELEGIACEIIDKEITVFGYSEIKHLGYSDHWSDLKKLLIFRKSETFFEVSEYSCSEIESEVSFFNENTNKDSVMEFSVTNDCEMLRFSHVRFIEVLAAQNVLNCIEDFMSVNRKSTYIEAFEFQKVFLSVFPYNFLFSRKYREVLVLFSQFCHENLFENFVKYLIGMNSVEFCYLAERVLKQSSSKNFKHLENKVKIQKSELILKDFSQGVTHCSETVRNICKLQLLSVNASVAQITTTQLVSILPNCSWFMLFSLKSLIKTMKLETIYECISQHMNLLLQSISSHSAYSCTFFNILLKIFVSSIEKTKTDPPAVPPKTNEGPTNEKTLRTSLENIRLRRNNVKDSVKGYSKLEKKLLELLMKCKGLDLKHALKCLLCIDSKKNLIKTCLIQRAKIFEFDKKKIIDCIYQLKCNDLESFEFLVTSFFEESLTSEVKKILKEIDVQKLKKMSNALVQKRVYEGILGFGYCCRYEIDNEIIEQLINFIDNSNNFISYLGISALYTIMKPIQNLKSEETKTLIVPLAEIITGRIKVIKNIENIRIKYLKCVLTLFSFMGEYKKVAEISEEFLSIENEKNISKIYKFLSNSRINSRYLERFRKPFCEQIYGNNGKYVLKLAENNISWYSEYTATLIITDPNHRFSSKNAAKLLNKWDAVVILDKFCCVERCKYLSRVGEILEFVDKTENFETIEKFEAVINYIESNFFEIISEYGIIIADVLSKFRKNNEDLRNWVLKFLLECDNIEYMEIAANVWNRIFEVSGVNVKIEKKLKNWVEKHPEKVVLIGNLLKLKSDELVSSLMACLLNGKLQISMFESVFSLLQCRKSFILVAIHKLIYYSSSNSEFSYLIHMKTKKLIRNLTIHNDGELEVFIEAVCKHNCSPFLEPVWKYLLNKTVVNPRYFLSDYAEELLQSNVSWDSKFTFKFCKILGFLRVKKVYDDGTVSTLSNEL